MSKGDLQRKLKDLLDRRFERLAECVKKDERTSALMFLGEVGGVAASMYTAGIIDFDQMEYIRAEAREIYGGGRSEDEA